ncbi:hypothetical protein JAAARDRAFT_499138 [Jaapia argillacea MUCL 33604]|uniref:Uncharacterized protein n=1 Tax=Jaapia argillacea MUCL 33604 TaxID=933084 RepID=A0A067PA24_9AGAM|nr:hypothetical protein JAAARDRAFT_499138 [Jaapia argillacea MUCL 33604]
MHDTDPQDPRPTGLGTTHCTIMTDDTAGRLSDQSDQSSLGGPTSGVLAEASILGADEPVDVIVDEEISLSFEEDQSNSDGETTSSDPSQTNTQDLTGPLVKYVLDLWVDIEPPEHCEELIRFHNARVEAASWVPTNGGMDSFSTTTKQSQTVILHSRSFLSCLL